MIPTLQRAHCQSIYNLFNFLVVSLVGVKDRVVFFYLIDYLNDFSFRVTKYRGFFFHDLCLKTLFTGYIFPNLFLSDMIPKDHNPIVSFFNYYQCFTTILKNWELQEK